MHRTLDSLSMEGSHRPDGAPCNILSQNCPLGSEVLLNFLFRLDPSGMRLNFVAIGFRVAPTIEVGSGVQICIYVRNIAICLELSHKLICAELSTHCQWKVVTDLMGRHDTFCLKIVLSAARFH